MNLDAPIEDFRRWILRGFLAGQLDGPEADAASVRDLKTFPLEPPTLAQIGARVAATALDLWKSEIQEPPGEGWRRIDEFIRGPKGLGWTTADAVKWRPDHRYDKNGMFAWCGAFAAFCHGTHGLKAEIRKKHLASTYRLFNFCKGSPRDIAIGDARPGDLAIVSDGSRTYGEHVTVIVGIVPEKGLFRTVEGNARGKGAPSASKASYEGVIERTRPYVETDPRAVCPISGRSQGMEVVKVYRFTLEDYDL